MYNAGDDTYKKQPKVMSAAVVLAIINNVKKHCLKHDLKEFDFVFHGGEPLLAGIPFFKNFIAQADLLLKPLVDYSIAVQTNGTLIDEAWSLFFKENKIFAGVSIDGTEEVHDSQRYYHSGKGSFKDVINGLSVLRKHNPVSIITVVDPYSDPVELYAMLKTYSIERLNTIIPYANYDHPPLNVPNYTQSKATVFADWLIALYDVWKQDRTPGKPTIMLFDQIVSLIMGNVNAGNDVLGETTNELLVIETDGSIEPAGSLKICGDGFTKQGLNVLHCQIDDAMDKNLIEMYYNSHKNLPAKCTGCEIKNVCGGGLFASRYKTATGFNNPSVYCHDWMKLVSHIQNSIIDLFPNDNIIHKYITRLNYEAIKNQHLEISDV